MQKNGSENPMPKKTKCIDSLRHNEYYDMQSIFDEFYNESIKGSEFHDLMDNL